MIHPDILSGFGGWRYGEPSVRTYEFADGRRIELTTVIAEHVDWMTGQVDQRQTGATSITMMAGFTEDEEREFVELWMSRQTDPTAYSKLEAFIMRFGKGQTPS